MRLERLGAEGEVLKPGACGEPTCRLKTTLATGEWMGAGGRGQEGCRAAI